MRHTQTEFFNLALIVASCIISVQVPFHLFLWAYAVLGPLHYLTEIFWLHDKNFFLPQKKSVLILLGFTVVCAALFWCNEFAAFSKHPLFQQHGNAIISGIFFMAVCTAAILTLIKKNVIQIILWCICLFMSIWLSYNSTYLFIFGILTATLIHVAFFTFIFMLQGALKHKSTIAIAGALTYVACWLYILYGPVKTLHAPLSKNIYEKYAASGFHLVNYSIAVFLEKAAVPYNLVSEVSLRIQALIAFSYTYHYLNWFSKVNIIRWNNIPRQHMIITLLMWILSVSLYAFHFKIGFLVLLLLSLAHVFLEFPLNVISIKNLLPFKKS